MELAMFVRLVLLGITMGMVYTNEQARGNGCEGPKCGDPGQASPEGQERAVEVKGDDDRWGLLLDNMMAA